MEFQRDKYLQKLIHGKENNLVKIVTGIRRCGKSYLLFNLFKRHLLESGVPDTNIVSLTLDDWDSQEYRDPNRFMQHVSKRLKETEGRCFILVDEVQLLDRFVEVLLSLMHNDRCDVYVTGSNSRFLSSDVVTEFRGRGDEIRLSPLSFSEYYAAFGGDKDTSMRLYSIYGGLPQVALIDDVSKKKTFLKNLFQSTYLRDVIERNKVHNDEGLEELVKILASAIGSPTNPKKIADTFKSVSHQSITDKTISVYISHLLDAYIIQEAMRYDVKGRKYIGSNSKYYFSDMGIRNAIINFRQQEPTHIMENVIYNELVSRGYSVDVGNVETWYTNAQGKSARAYLEIDFVVNNDDERIYVQSAYSMPTREKVAQEQKSLLSIKDGFRKVIVTGDNVAPWTTDEGIRIINYYDFLLDEKLLFN
ncbi:MAG: ATP-binding protein [Bacteroidaceae bacterium]|nr:ATP-binding protein [Bacteroidaceae bacterium]